ncbi:hypothetical protein Ae706Ps2_3272c [Pseudonocardia sp. Ae706_Ps2]|nr:hypothetical protein Ae505Ps2_1960c [Pseudonocardia sp. Ae505_Ps2]OLM24839.1 hypothetical protein Ae706Ps2_3272c [Pseudonocardia sp. Ae706_Ps2]
MTQDCYRGRRSTGRRPAGVLKGLFGNPKSEQES